MPGVDVATIGPTAASVLLIPLRVVHASVPRHSNDKHGPGQMRVTTQVKGSKCVKLQGGTSVVDAC